MAMKLSELMATEKGQRAVKKAAKKLEARPLRKSGNKEPIDLAKLSPLYRNPEKGVSTDGVCPEVIDDKERAAIENLKDIAVKKFDNQPQEEATEEVKKSPASEKMSMAQIYSEIERLEAQGISVTKNECKIILAIKAVSLSKGRESVAIGYKAFTRDWGLNAKYFHRSKKSLIEKGIVSVRAVPYSGSVNTTEWTLVKKL